MWPPSKARTEAIRRAASPSPSWTRVLSLAKRHQILGLVNDGLARAQITMPSDIAAELQVQTEAMVCENLALAGEAARLQKLFDAVDLPVLFLKGTSLSMLAYGSIGLRSAKDIDMLVPYERLTAAVECLVSNGYQRIDPPTDISDRAMRLIMPLRKDLAFIHEQSSINVELHWQLFRNPYAMDQTSTFAASQIVPLTESVGLRTLGKEDLFTYLCVHGARHWWYQVKWLADVGALLADGRFDIELVYRAAAEKGARRAAAQAILLCSRLLSTPLPEMLSKQLVEIPTIHWLKVTALNAMNFGGGELIPREGRFGTTRGSLSVLLLGESWRYRMAELRSLMNNTADISMVPLPTGLSFLYPLLRIPLWAWRKMRQQETS
jgi:hypothetical protein